MIYPCPHNSKPNKNATNLIYFYLHYLNWFDPKGWIEKSLLTCSACPALLITKATTPDSLLHCTAHTFIHFVHTELSAISDSDKHVFPSFPSLSTNWCPRVCCQVLYLIPPSSCFINLPISHILNFPLSPTRRLGGREGLVAPALGIKCTTAEMRIVNEVREDLKPKVIMMVFQVVEECLELALTGEAFLESSLSQSLLGRSEVEMDGCQVVEACLQCTDLRYLWPMYLCRLCIIYLCI